MQRKKNRANETGKLDAVRMQNRNFVKIGIRLRDCSFTSTSAKKLASSGSFGVVADRSCLYVLVSFILFDVLSERVKCKECNGPIKFLRSDIRGLGFKLVLKGECYTEVVINSCPKINKGYEINRRIVFIMRLIGVGYNGLEMFCGLMDLTNNFSAKYYYDLMKQHISVAVSAVADSILKKAGEEEREMTRNHGLPEDHLAVSGDGSWSKRGFSSLVGLSSVIGKYTNKVLDVFISSKTCKACEMKKATVDKASFDIWYDSEHKDECTANYEGSSGGMEVQGMLEIFKRSQQLHGAFYKYYIGDGDSKTYATLQAAKIYGETFIIEKLECVLHVGKRMYRYLAEVKKMFTQKKKLAKEAAKSNPPPPKPKPDKRPRKQKGAPPPPKPEKYNDLTGNLMKKLSTYYSLMIQRHPDSKENMKHEIWAGYYHAISTDAEPQHHHCDESWCTFLKAKKANEAYTHKPSLNPELRDMVKNAYEKLTNDELLERCLGGNTQNNNECFNKTVWAIAPKHNFVGKRVLDIATQVALSIFNEGRISVLKMMEVMGIKIGSYAYEFAKFKNSQRMQIAEKQSIASSKEGRSAKKNAEQIEEDGYERVEGLLYGPGIAD